MKKVTLFVDKTLRQELGKLTPPPDVHSVWGMAYSSAMDFFAKLVVFGSDPLIAGPTDCPKHETTSKYLCRFHGEGGHVRQAFRDAHRIEALLTIRYYKAVLLEVSFYRSGEKKPYQQVRFSFSQSDGSVASSSESV